MNETKAYTTKNTFSKSPGCAQIASYIIFLLMVVLFYVSVRPNLHSGQIALTIFFTICTAAMVITTLITSYIDPSDQVMIMYKNDRSKYIKK